MAVRWVCPTCGSGLNAPQRPRKNDVRRYCLRCSETAGVLVERAAPALERKRKQSTARTAERQQAKRQQTKDAKLISLVDANGLVRKVDVVKLTRRALRDCGYADPDRVQVTTRTRQWGISGRAWPTYYPPRIHYSIQPGASYERMLEVAHHEAAHVASGLRIAREDQRWHGPVYRRCLADALQKRWPFLTYGSVNGGKVYDADDRIVAQMIEYVREGGEL